MTESRTEAYEELANEKDLVKKLKYFDKQVTALENILKPFYENDIYSDLNLEDKVKYDIFLSYSLTSLYWMYTRTQGENPFEQPVKGEVERVQEYMKMYHSIKERKKAPQLDKAAAKRFVKHGLFDLNSIKPGKRKTFDVDDDEDGQDTSNTSQEVQEEPDNDDES